MFSIRSVVGRPAAILLLAACVNASSPRAPLTLAIQNDNAAVPLRCVLVLAHFVSVDVPLVLPGDTVSIEFSRDVKTGSLIVAAPDGREMEVENLLCGSDDRWAETRGDVPLLPLRTAASERLGATCRLVTRLDCKLNAP